MVPPLQWQWATLLSYTWVNFQNLKCPAWATNQAITMKAMLFSTKFYIKFLSNKIISIDAIKNINIIFLGFTALF
jgi:hypothetical protein